ncbi:MAG: HD domain-containing phosphohydrolase [Vicinamibacteraceae bacterium]
MRASTISVRNSARPALRVSTVLEGLSHALDLTEGHPRGHATRTALIGLRLGRALHLAPGLQAELLYALLLKDAGCSANASLVCDLFGGCDQEVKRAVWQRDWRRVPEQLAHAIEYIGRGGSLVARMRQFGKFAIRGAQGSGTKIFTVRCERGAKIARMIGLSETVVDAIRAMDEHWDGGGYPYKLRGDQTPLLARIVGLAQVVEIFWSEGGADRAIDVARERRGRWFDPALVDTFVAAARDRSFWVGLADARLDRDLLSLVPAGLEIPTDDALLDRIADAFALIIDAKSPYTFEHSALVAEYALAINDRLGPRAVDPVRLRRAALLHDIGKLTVPNTILDSPARLSPSERAVIEQHPAYTLSLLQRVPVFSAFADDAANHHEWVDGRGYSRGLSGAALSTTTRIIAVADVLEALTADRPYQHQPMPFEGVEAVLTTGGGTHFDEECVAAATDGVIEQAFANRARRRSSAQVA